jgi:tRNA-dihydrouridine synthase
MRTHLAWYFKGTACASAMRQAINECHTLEDYQTVFEEALAWN